MESIWHATSILEDPLSFESFCRVVDAAFDVTTVSPDEFRVQLAQESAGAPG